MINPNHIWKSPKLPSLPAVAIRLLELTSDAETDIHQVVEAVRIDPAICARILKSANSSFFGVRAEVKSVDRAVALLGTTVSTTLALSFSLSDDALSSGPLAKEYRSYWMQSVVQGTAAETIGQLVSPALAGEYCMAGLMLDIGRLAMLKTIPFEYRPILKSSEEQGASLVESEARMLGINHQEVGRNLLKEWKLPGQILDAVGGHHSLPSSSANKLAIGAAMASRVGDYFCSAAKGVALDQLCKLGAEHFGWSLADTTSFLDKIDTRLKDASALFNINAEDLGDPRELMLEANEQLAALAMREHMAGAQAAVRHQAVEQEKRQLENHNRELQDQVLHDALTKLYNRRFFDETLTREVAKAVRTATPVAAIFIDVDHFKLLNDNYGHPFGDQVLQRIAELFMETVRATDVAARFGGEEFVVLVERPTEHGVQRLAERIRERIEQEEFFYGSTKVAVTVSLGAAICMPSRKDTDVGPRLIAAADESLYEAKRAGRNRTCLRNLIDAHEQQIHLRVTAARFSRFLVGRKLVDVPGITEALLDCKPQTLRAGDIAVQQGFLSSEDIERILQDQDRTGERFATVAVRLNLLTEAQMVFILALQQEDPKGTAATVIRLGLTSPDQVVRALEEYYQIHRATQAVSV